MLTASEIRYFEQDPLEIPMDDVILSSSTSETCHFQQDPSEICHLQQDPSENGSKYKYPLELNKIIYDLYKF